MYVNRSRVDAGNRRGSCARSAINNVWTTLNIFTSTYTYTRSGGLLNSPLYRRTYRYIRTYIYIHIHVHTYTHTYTYTYTSAQTTKSDNALTRNGNEVTRVILYRRELTLNALSERRGQARYTHLYACPRRFSTVRPRVAP